MSAASAALHEGDTPQRGGAKPWLPSTAAAQRSPADMCQPSQTVDADRAASGRPPLRVVTMASLTSRSALDHSDGGATSSGAGGTSASDQGEQLDGHSNSGADSPAAATTPPAVAARPARSAADSRALPESAMEHGRGKGLWHASVKSLGGGGGVSEIEAAPQLDTPPGRGAPSDRPTARRGGRGRGQSGGRGRGGGLGGKGRGVSRSGNETSSTSAVGGHEGAGGTAVFPRGFLRPSSTLEAQPDVPRTDANQQGPGTSEKGFESGQARGSGTGPSKGSGRGTSGGAPIRVNLRFGTVPLSAPVSASTSASAQPDSNTGTAGVEGAHKEPKKPTAKFRGPQYMTDTGLADGVAFADMTLLQLQELLHHQPAKPGLPNRWTRTLRQHATSRGSGTGANAAAEQVTTSVPLGPSGRLDGHALGADAESDADVFSDDGAAASLSNDRSHAGAASDTGDGSVDKHAEECHMESDSQTGSQTVRRDLVKLAGWTGPASKSKQAINSSKKGARGDVNSLLIAKPGKGPHFRTEDGTETGRPLANLSNRELQVLLRAKNQKGLGTPWLRELRQLAGWVSQRSMTPAQRRAYQEGLTGAAAAAATAAAATLATAGGAVGEGGTTPGTTGTDAATAVPAAVAATASPPGPALGRDGEPLRISAGPEGTEGEHARVAGQPLNRTATAAFGVDGPEGDASGGEDGDLGGAGPAAAATPGGATRRSFRGHQFMTTTGQREGTPLADLSPKSAQELLAVQPVKTGPPDRWMKALRAAAGHPSPIRRSAGGRVGKRGHRVFRKVVRGVVRQGAAATARAAAVLDAAPAVDTQDPAVDAEEVSNADDPAIRPGGDGSNRQHQRESFGASAGRDNGSGPHPQQMPLRKQGLKRKVCTAEDDELSRSLQRQPRRRRVAVSPQQQQQQDLGAVAQQVPLPSPHNRRSARLTIHVQPLNAPPAAGDEADREDDFETEVSCEPEHQDESEDEGHDNGYDDMNAAHADEDSGDNSQDYEDQPVELQLGQPSLPSRRGKGSLPLALMPPSRDTADVAAEQLQQQLGDVLQRLGVQSEELATTDWRLHEGVESDDDCIDVPPRAEAPAEIVQQMARDYAQAGSTALKMQRHYEDRLAEYRQRCVHAAALVKRNAARRTEAVSKYQQLVARVHQAFIQQSQGSGDASGGTGGKTGGRSDDSNVLQAELDRVNAQLGVAQQHVMDLTLYNQRSEETLADLEADKEALVAALVDASVQVPPLSEGNSSRGPRRSGDGSLDEFVGATAAEVAKLREQLADAEERARQAAQDLAQGMHAIDRRAKRAADVTNAKLSIERKRANQAEADMNTWRQHYETLRDVQSPGSGNGGGDSASASQLRAAEAAREVAVAGRAQAEAGRAQADVWRAQAEARCSKMETELEDFRAELDVLHEREEQCARLEEQSIGLDNALREVQEREEHCAALEGETAGLENALREINAGLADEQVVLEQKAYHCEQLINENGGLKRTKATLEQQKATLEQEKAEVGQQVAALGQRNVALEQARATLEQEKTALERRAAEAEKDIAELAAENTVRELHAHEATRQRDQVQKLADEKLAEADDVIAKQRAELSLLRTQLITAASRDPSAEGALFGERLAEVAQAAREANIAALAAADRRAAGANDQLMSVRMEVEDLHAQTINLRAQMLEERAAAAQAQRTAAATAASILSQQEQAGIATTTAIASKLEASQAQLKATEGKLQATAESLQAAETRASAAEARVRACEEAAAAAPRVAAELEAARVKLRDAEEASEQLVAALAEAESAAELARAQRLAAQRRAADRGAAFSAAVEQRASQLTSDLEKKLEQWASLCQSADTTSLNLRAERNSLVAQRGSMTTELAEKAAELQDLRQQLEAIQLEADGLRSEREGLKEALSFAEAKVDSYKASSENLSLHLDQTEREAAGLIKEVRELRQQLTAAKGAAEASLREVEGRASASAVEAAQNAAEVLRLQEDLSAAMHREGASASRRKNLEAELAALGLEMAELRAKKTTRDAEVQQWRQQEEALKLKVASLDSDNARHQKKLSKQTKTIDGLEEQIATLQTTIRRINDED